MHGANMKILKQSWKAVGTEHLLLSDTRNRKETNVFQPGLLYRFSSYTFLLWTVFILNWFVWKWILCYSNRTVFHSSVSVKNKVIRCYMYICSYDVRKKFLNSALRMSKESLCSLSINLLVSCMFPLRLYARFSYLTNSCLRSHLFLRSCTLLVYSLPHIIVPKGTVFN
jgi:hypothetical protein